MQHLLSQPASATVFFRLFSLHVFPLIFRISEQLLLLPPQSTPLFFLRVRRLSVLSLYQHNNLREEALLPTRSLSVPQGTSVFWLLLSMSTRLLEVPYSEH